MGKIYRHVFFQQKVITKGAGTTDVRYTGKLFGNAGVMVGFRKMYDPAQDLYVACGKCAMNKYRSFIKV